jgi:hypothetical protein
LCPRSPAQLKPEIEFHNLLSKDYTTLSTQRVRNFAADERENSPLAHNTERRFAWAFLSIISPAQNTPHALALPLVVLGAHTRPKLSPIKHIHRAAAQFEFVSS